MRRSLPPSLKLWRTGGVGLFCFLALSNANLKAKEVLIQANSIVKQVKFCLEEKDFVFTSKYQNINGKVAEQWLINDESISKEAYDKKIAWAENEEARLVLAAEEQKRIEIEQKEKELLARKKEEEEQFAKELRQEALKKLVKLELEKVEASFAKLDKYRLEPFFVFEENSFSSEESFQEAKVGLVAQARGVVIKSSEELSQEELKETLTKLEVIPDKVERFFRQSVRFAINQCNDTKRLKELLSLIS